MSDNTANFDLALATENAALAEAQELLIETAVDAGEMHFNTQGMYTMTIVHDLIRPVVGMVSLAGQFQ